MEETLAILDGFIQEGGPHHIVTLDASMCITASEDPELAQIIRRADLVTPDSAGVLWACARSGHPFEGRVSGVEIVQRLCALSPHTGYRIWFLGAAPGVARQAAENARKQFPGCRIVGVQDGYFSEDQEPEVVAQIAEAGPDILCVAMGIPRQEKFIARNRGRLGVPVMIGVGGTLDVMAGIVNRAPHWMQRLNLEWLYRLAKNPKKIGKVMTLPRFLWRTLRAGKRAVQA
jgi:N-acetylglucosaminyldiphosphoundecaprenol N-acetyl-beta-D-mannosaminyltransferase